MDNRYWENASGYYDPTAKKAIDNQYEPDRNVKDGIYEVKQLLKGRGLQMINRIAIKNTKTGKIYK